jgi:L-ascorbate metabolism protein UlaG (beta-lactamase superfamily)
MDFFEKSTFRNGRFEALPEGKGKGLLDVLKWKWTSRPKPWPKWRDNEKELTALPKSNELTLHQASATWINHSTLLLKVDGLTILTDPVFSDFVGPLRLFLGWGLGIKRTTPPAQKLESLPPIDIVLISHNHYDHLDAFSIKTLFSLYNPLFITPLGNASLLKSLGCTRVIELDWWENYPINPDFNIGLTPALHWSQRTLWDTCRALWGGFVIRSKSLKIFFAGDTGYHSHFQKIYEKYGPMDLSLLPIGAYEPRWFLKEVHMDPADAVQAHLDLHSKLSVGIHFGTFRLTDEGIDDPIHELKIALVKAQINPLSFIAPSLGQTIFI